MQTQEYKLGIDGGGTGCRARLTDMSGHMLGEGRAGPANILLGAQVALASIMKATHLALERAGLDVRSLGRTRAGLGLAGANVPSARAQFEAVALPFLSATIRSDAEVACLGAHGGRDGGILILGTGSQGIVHCAGRFISVGGWGFPASDTGSGAVLGRAAVRRALLAHEGIEKPSAFTAQLMARFDNRPDKVVEWAASAQPRDWAEFAPMVFEHAAGRDAVALQLVHASAADAQRLVDRLAALGAAQVVLMGGLAAPTRPYLADAAAALLAEPAGDALDGALMLASAHGLS